MDKKAETSPISMPGRGQNPPKIIRGLIISGILLLVAALVGIILINQPGQQADGASNAPIRAGMTMPDFTLNDINGVPVRLSDFRGKTVLINAWATWCPPCRAEMPSLNAFYQAQRDKNFVILAVNVGESKSVAASFASENNLEFPVLLDQDEKLMDRWNIHDYPTSILIGKDGTVKMVHLGMFTSDTLESEILPLLQ